MRIYLDLVFFSNFFGDFLCLCLTGAIYRRISIKRRVFAAAAGGIYGAAAVLPHMGFLGLLPVKAVAALVIAALAYIPAPPAEMVRAVLVFLVSSMLLCGGAEFIMANGGGAQIPVIFGMACLLCCLLAMLRSRIYSRYLTYELCCGRKKLRGCGFYDSGNRLVVGENGMRVIVADERILAELFGEGACAANLSEWVESDRIMRVPFCGAAGGELAGVKLDYAKVCGRRYDDVVLGVCENRLPDKVILHSTMV